jgi:hypothetical protein
LEPAPSGEKREKPKSQHQAFEGNSQPKFYLSIIKSSTIVNYLASKQDSQIASKKERNNFITKSRKEITHN